MSRHPAQADAAGAGVDRPQRLVLAEHGVARWRRVNLAEIGSAVVSTVRWLRPMAMFLLGWPASTIAISSCCRGGSAAMLGAAAALRGGAFAGVAGSVESATDACEQVGRANRAFVASLAIVERQPEIVLRGRDIRSAWMHSLPWMPHHVHRVDARWRTPPRILALVPAAVSSPRSVICRPACGLQTHLVA